MEDEVLVSVTMQDVNLPAVPNAVGGVCPCVLPDRVPHDWLQK
jgi:hypothetical protein